MDKMESMGDVLKRTMNKICETSKAPSERLEPQGGSEHYEEAEADLIITIGQLIAAFPNAKVSEGTAAVYARMLMDIEPEHLKKAMEAIISEAEFFPSVAALRKRAMEFEGGFIPDPDIAWNAVVAALPEVGRNMAHRPKLRYALAQEIADGLGWRRLYLYQDMYRKDFISAYREAADRTKTERALPHYLRKELAERRQLSLNAQTETRLLGSGDDEEE